MATISSIVKLNDQFTNTLKSITNALSITIGQFEKLQSTSNNSIDVNKLTQARSEISKASAGLQELGNSIDNNKKKQDNFNSSLNSTWEKLKNIATIYLSFQGAKNLVNAGDNYINNTAKLDLVNDKLQTTEELQQKIYEASQRSLMAYGDMSSAVAKLGTTAKKSFNSNDEMITFAELMNKQFTLAGASVQERSAAMYQITQAMASGRLQGDEFRSIIENAPLLAQTIAEYTGMTQAQLKKASSEGLITADIIKKSLFSTAKETNEMFNKMPMTFRDLWTQAMNKINRGMEPFYQRLRALWNSKDFQQFLDITVNGLLVLLSVGLTVFNGISTAVNFLYNNWSLFQPLLVGLGVAATVYFGIMAAGTIKTIALKLWDIAVTGYQTVATFLLTTATLGLGVAMSTLPITWVIYGVIALIAIFYTTIAVINKVAGTSISATGIIAGSVAWLGATIWNIIVAITNAFLQRLDQVANIVISVVEWILNVCVGGFNSFGGAVANLIGNVIDWFLSLGKIVTKIIDAIFGTNWTAGLNALSKKVTAWGKNENAITLERNVFSNNASLQRVSATDLYDKGYNWGANLGNTVKDKLGSALNLKTKLNPTSKMPLGSIGTDMKNANSPIIDKLGEIAKNTAGTNNELMRNNEDMTYLRDIAERNAINQISNKTVKVEMVNNNNVNNEMDLDKMVDYLGEKLYNTMSTSAEGIHY